MWEFGNRGAGQMGVSSAVMHGDTIGIFAVLRCDGRRACSGGPDRGE